MLLLKSARTSLCQLFGRFRQYSVPRCCPYSIKKVRLQLQAISQAIERSRVRSGNLDISECDYYRMETSHFSCKCLHKMSFMQEKGHSWKRSPLWIMWLILRCCWVSLSGSFLDHRLQTTYLGLLLRFSCRKNLKN